MRSYCRYPLYIILILIYIYRIRRQMMIHRPLSKEINKKYLQKKYAKEKLKHKNHHWMNSWELQNLNPWRSIPTTWDLRILYLFLYPIIYVWTNPITYVPTLSGSMAARIQQQMLTILTEVDGVIRFWYVWRIIARKILLRLLAIGLFGS